jgi:uncharacterized protein (TIGR02646 family)
MRYIQKTSTPQFFIDNSQGLKRWEDYSKKKTLLREYILENEQNYLCIYCESKISSDENSSHVEHIRPKAHDKYPHLTFEYKNLAVSCNGTCHNAKNDLIKHSCGHLKDNEYDETLFLNPVEIKDIRDYFEYDIDEGEIKASSKDVNKASYMITTLHLNDNGLLTARKKALQNFIQKMNCIDISERKETLKKRLDQENSDQISFLKFRFKTLLEGN